MRLSALLAVLMLPFLAAPAGARTYGFDLADTNFVTLPASAGKTRIEFRNAIAASYSIEIVIRTATIPAFETVSLPLFPRVAGDNCDAALKKMRDELSAATSEAAVRDLLRSQRETLKKAGCDPAVIDREERERTRDLSFITEEFDLGHDEEAVITASRKTAAGNIATWKLTLRTPMRGQWLTTYGFAMIPDRDERYWLRPTAVASEFEVVRQEDREDELKFIPALFFTWLPRLRAGADFVNGPTAGLGVGQDTYSVFLGWSVLYNWNLQLSGGGSAFRISRLSGKYQAGDLVHENLTDDQLHRQTFWLGWYAAVTFRFGGSPFESKTTTTPATTTP